MKPPYDITLKILKLISSISEKIGEVNANYLNKQSPQLRKQNRIKTIHSSLQIEGRVLKKYERENSTPAPDNWFVLSPSYDNDIDNKNRTDGDDYSFVNYVGDDKLGVKSIIETINLMRDNLDFKIPVYLIQGNEDIMTPKENSKKYFDKIKAPKKEYFLLPNSAHGFNQSVVEAQYKIFKSIKTL